MLILAAWEDTALLEKPIKIPREVAAQVILRSKAYDEWGFYRKMRRGFGISAIFAGESGTGKTMVAEVIPNKPTLSFYRIDLLAG